LTHASADFFDTQTEPRLQQLVRAISRD